MNQADNVVSCTGLSLDAKEWARNFRSEKARGMNFRARASEEDSAGSGEGPFVDSSWRAVVGFPVAMGATAPGGGLTGRDKGATVMCEFSFFIVVFVFIFMSFVVDG
jgi:hypothetical protein